jgi:hypothetical protein
MACRKLSGDPIRYFLYAGDTRLREIMKSGIRVNKAFEKNTRRCILILPGEGDSVD